MQAVHPQRWSTFAVPAMPRERIIILTGAGVSAESGLKTFRDSDGLWESYRVEDVATPEAWERDPQLVLRFYDERRAQVLKAEPNAAHRAIAQLENGHDVEVITQNIDDLHERAGSTRVLHLHGEILKARSTADPLLIVPVNGPSLPWGARCKLGSQLRPHIVWFGEPVPLIEEAAARVATADRVIIVGTSLQVYPAAGLVHYARAGVPVHLIDPRPALSGRASLEVIHEKASTGMPMLADRLLKT
jgi:NAD-dependent deacetylase